MSGGLRFAPAPPNVSCVPASGNLYPSGPAPYTCPGVDKPPDIPYSYNEQHKKPGSIESGFSLLDRGD